MLKVRYGGVRMPVYSGVIGSMHMLHEWWRVDGTLSDGRRFSIDIHHGYVFDGASVPRLLWPVCGHPLEIPRIAAALAHDWLYAAQLCDRSTADAIYKAILLRVGTGGFRASVETAVVRLCGWSAWRKKTTKQISFAQAHGVLAIG